MNLRTVYVTSISYTLNMGIEHTYVKGIIPCPLWVKSGLFSSYDFGRDISLFHELNSLIPRKNSLLICLGNLAGNPIVPAGYRGAKTANHGRNHENSLYFPCLTGKSLTNLTETSSLETAPTTTQFPANPALRDVEEFLPQFQWLSRIDWGILWSGDAYFAPIWRRFPNRLRRRKTQPHYWILRIRKKPDYEANPRTWRCFSQESGSSVRRFIHLKVRFRGWRP